MHFVLWYGQETGHQGAECGGKSLILSDIWLFGSVGAVWRSLGSVVHQQFSEKNNLRFILHRVFSIVPLILNG